MGFRRARSPRRTFAPVAALTTGLAAGCATTLALYSSEVDLVTVAAPTVAAGAVAGLITRAALRSPDAKPRTPEARRTIDHDLADRAALRELSKRLDEAENERRALELITRAFDQLLPGRPVELHLVDPIEPILVLAATSEATSLPARKTNPSPWTSMAARTGETLVFATTDNDDCCDHLRTRSLEPHSAVSVPLTAMNKIVGVLYAFGPAGIEPTSAAVGLVEDLASIIASRVALMRTVLPTVEAGHESYDRLTGLPDRPAMQAKVSTMLRSRLPFSIAIADVDDFGLLNDEYGRDAGDQVLQIIARVARRHLRPDDIIGRVGGDEVLFVLPRTRPEHVAKAMQRITEELRLEQNHSRAPQFSMSIGVAGSAEGATIESILHQAAAALEDARENGGNRTVVAELTDDPIPSA